MLPLNKKQFGLFLAAVSLCVISAEAAPAKKAPTPRDVEVDTVKDAYWNRTSDGDIEVVQNRQYSKKNRLSIQGSIATVMSDPFLSEQSVGAALGYHFTESLGLVAHYRKFIVSDSGAANDLRTGLTTGSNSMANTNRPNSYYGGELEWSPYYGKISVSGATIIHYDAHFLLGAGLTDTETGKNFTPSVGFGPQFYLSNSVALRLDYRFAMYKETIPEKNPLIVAPIAGNRTNYFHSLTLGLEVFL